ncbi:MAG TPA: hypothetical protein VJB82_04005 [Candidatus Peribacterales bacterium]|nr:hypothetical protein [Candidatus Peribacterales bacterium]
MEDRSMPRNRLGKYFAKLDGLQKPDEDPNDSFPPYQSDDINHWHDNHEPPPPPESPPALLTTKRDLLFIRTAIIAVLIGIGFLGPCGAQFCVRQKQMRVKAEKDLMGQGKLIDQLRERVKSLEEELRDAKKK